MLSNTAVPKYYGAFRQAVINGEIPVCETISLEMNRIDDLIRNPGVYYDPGPVEGWIRFCENELTLTDGSNLVLLDTFKLWAEQVYGWYYFKTKSIYEPYKDRPGGHFVRRTVKRRLIQKQYLIIARRNAKTLYAECHQAYGLTVDTDTTHQVTTAPTMKQAEEVIQPFATAISRARGPLFKFLTEGSIQNTTGSKAKRQKLASTKKGIENFLTNSYLEVRAMSINKLQGLQNKYSSVDEWLSGDIKEDVIGALEQGASKLDDYIVISVSSEGTVRNGVGDSIKMELMDILKGDYIAPNVSIWWYKQDNVKEINYPDLWKKSNPNLERTVDFETIQKDLDRATNSPAARNDILAKVFNIPMEGYTYFFTYEQTLCHEKKRYYWGMPCSMGADLSQGDDFCAFTFMFPLSRGYFGIKTKSYITERTYMRLTSAKKEKYKEFIDDGTLIVMEGTVLNIVDVFDDIDQHIVDCDYDVRCFGFDPYNSETFVERWIRENGEYGVEKVIQGVKTESVPLGELHDMAEDRLLLFDEPLMSFAMQNCVVVEDTNGNRKLLKRRHDEKIDNVSAMMDAYVAFKRHPEMFE